MKKLLKYKEWLTLPEAARHISHLLDDDVTEVDVVRLALDGHLEIAVHLVNGAYARWCCPIKFEEVEHIKVPSLDGKTTISIPRYGRCWGDWRGAFQVDSRIVTDLERGVWDLSLEDGGRNDLEAYYQKLTGGPDVTEVATDGVIVANIQGRMFELQSHLNDNEFYKGTVHAPYHNPENFHPAGGLPADSVFVVRSSAIEKFEAAMRQEDSTPAPVEKPLHPRERNTFLKIIKALCSAHDIDIKQPYKIGEIIKREAELSGVNISLETIASKLDEALKS